MPELPPILEFDPDPQAILNPPRARKSAENLPARGVLCFFQDVLSALVADGTLKEIGMLASEIGRNPIYEVEFQDQKLFVLHPGVGAPLAIGFMDELIAMGAQSFIACGGCGVLRKDLVAGHAVILTSAVRDEGTSYHYLPPSREVAASPAAVRALESTLQRQNIPYLLGKSWTTDALYRETVARRAARMQEGCEVVEMEASAFFAVAQFRGVTCGQIVYGGDLVVPEGWDRRDWHLRANDRLLMFWLAVEAASLL